MLAAIRRASSQINHLENGDQKLQTKKPVQLIIILLSGNVRQELKPKLWLFVLYLFDPNFLKMAPGTHNVATNQTHA
jgi:hypothetical protein